MFEWLSEPEGLHKFYRGQTEFDHEIETLLKKYSKEDVNNEGKRAVLTHIRVKSKKQDDHIPDLMDWCQSTTLISELGVLTDFQKTIMRVSDFTREFSNEVMKTVKG